MHLLRRPRPPVTPPPHFSLKSNQSERARGRGRGRARGRGSESASRRFLTRVYASRFSDRWSRWSVPRRRSRCSSLPSRLSRQPQQKMAGSKARLFNHHATGLHDESRGGGRERVEKRRVN